MSLAQHIRRFLHVLPVGIVLTGCAMDTEDAVRAQLGSWLSLGETLFFNSSRECSAGLFVAPSNRMRKVVQTVHSVRDGLHVMTLDSVVAFEIPGRSPTQVTEDIMTADLPTGLGFLNSGIAARNCMDEQVAAAYYEVLTTLGGVLIFDPETRGLAILDRDANRVFFARGGS